MAIRSSFRLIICSFLFFLQISPYPKFLMALGLLECFDSQSAEPIRLANCQPDEVCYSEYYALNTTVFNPTMAYYAHYFDRFCVHRRHCIDRGLLPDRPCLGFNQLDPVVARTFQQKLKQERLDPARLVHSLFCCCSRPNKCNEMGPKMLKKMFNVSVLEPQHQMGQRQRMMSGNGNKKEGRNWRKKASNGEKWIGASNHNQIQQIISIVFVAHIFNKIVLW